MTWSQTVDTCPSRVDTRFTHDFLTNEPIELQTSVWGQNGEEFHQQSNWNGPIHMTHVCHMSDAHVSFGMVQCFIFMTILYLLIPLSYRQV